MRSKDRQWLIFLSIILDEKFQVLPVENKVRNPDKFLAPFGVLTITFGVCSIFMTFLGFIGYTTFGDATGVTITVNIPSDG